MRPPARILVITFCDLLCRWLSCWHSASAIGRQLGIIGPAIASIVTTIGSAAAAGASAAAGRLGFVARCPASTFRADCSEKSCGSVSSGPSRPLSPTSTALVMTGPGRALGAAALAGYGIGVRLEFMLAPLAFGIGTGLTTLVGVASGAGDWKRAVRVAWIGAMLSFAIFGVVGWTAALLPGAGRGLHHRRPGRCRERRLPRPCRAFLLPVRLGLTLYFASQGAGRMSVAFVGRRCTHGRGGGRRLAGRRMAELGLDGVFAGNRHRPHRLWRHDRGRFARVAVEG